MDQIGNEASATDQETRWKTVDEGLDALPDILADLYWTGVTRELALLTFRLSSFIEVMEPEPEELREITSAFLQVYGFADTTLLFSPSAMSGEGTGLKSAKEWVKLVPGILDLSRMRNDWKFGNVHVALGIGPVVTEIGVKGAGGILFRCRDPPRLLCTRPEIELPPLPIFRVHHATGDLQRYAHEKGPLAFDPPLIVIKRSFNLGFGSQSLHKVEARLRVATPEPGPMFVGEEVRRINESTYGLEGRIVQQLADIAQRIVEWREVSTPDQEIWEGVEEQIKQIVADMQEKWGHVDNQWKTGVLLSMRSFVRETVKNSIGEDSGGLTQPSSSHFGKLNKFLAKDRRRIGRVSIFSTCQGYVSSIIRGKCFLNLLDTNPPPPTSSLNPFKSIFSRPPHLPHRSARLPHPRTEWLGSHPLAFGVSKKDTLLSSYFSSASIEEDFYHWATTRVRKTDDDPGGVARWLNLAFVVDDAWSTLSFVHHYICHGSGLRAQPWHLKEGETEEEKDWAMTTLAAGLYADVVHRTWDSREGFIYNFPGMDEPLSDNESQPSGR